MFVLSSEILLTESILITYDHLDAIERFHNETLRVYGVLEIRLSGKFTGEPRDYLAGAGKGKYSIADIGTWTWVKGWEMSGFTQDEMKEFPHLLKWIARIAERPAVQRGIGEKYKFN
jgi:glutathione S-transferase